MDGCVMILITDNNEEHASLLIQASTDGILQKSTNGTCLSNNILPRIQTGRRLRILM